MFSQYRRSILFLVLILTPFIQLGFSYYLSVQTLTFVLILSIFPLNNYLKKFIVISGMTVLVLILMQLFYLGGQDIKDNALRNGRVFLCFIVLLAFLSTKFSSGNLNKPIRRAISFISISLLIFVVMQRISFNQVTAFYIPREFYILNGENLGDSLAILYNTVRPSASFGEPSYLGFITLSLYVIVITKFENNKNKTVIIFTLWAIIFFSATLAGFIALLAVTALNSYKHGLSMKWIILLFLMVPAIFFIISYFSLTSTILLDRIFGLDNIKEDYSAYDRLIKPLFLISYTFNNYPLGIPIDLLGKFVGKENILNTDNGFLLLFINFGFTAFLIYTLIFVKIRKRPILGLYLLLASIFNGTVFGYDKIVIMAMVIMLMKDERNPPEKISLV